MTQTSEMQHGAVVVAAPPRSAAHGRAAAWYGAVRPSLRSYPLDWALCGLATAFGLGLDLHLLGIISVWFDEAFTYSISQER